MLFSVNPVGAVIQNDTESGFLLLAKNDRAVQMTRWCDCKIKQKTKK